MFKQQKAEDLLTARRITKLNFLQQDLEQIKESIQLLEDIQKAYKQIQQEAIQKTIPKKGSQLLTTQNYKIQELIYKAKVSQDVAESRIEITEQIAEEAAIRESDQIFSYQEVTKKHLKELEEKEAIAQEVERRIQDYQNELEIQKKKRMEKQTSAKKNNKVQIQRLDNEIQLAMETLDQVTEKYRQSKFNQEQISNKFRELYLENTQL